MSFLGGMVIVAVISAEALFISRQSAMVKQQYFKAKSQFNGVLLKRNCGKIKSVTQFQCEG